MKTSLKLALILSFCIASPVFAKTPIIIKTCQELQAINDQEGIYYLGNDIDCKGIQFKSLFSVDFTDFFRGQFDGRNHTIRNLHILGKNNEQYNSYIAFITKSIGATVRNLRIEDFSVEIAEDAIDPWTSNVSGLLGFAEKPTVANVVLKNGIIKGRKQDIASGLIGHTTDGNLNKIGIEGVTLTGVYTMAFYGDMGTVVDIDGSIVSGYGSFNIDQAYFRGTMQGEIGAALGGYSSVLPNQKLKFSNMYVNANVQSTGYFCGAGIFDADTVGQPKPNVEIKNVYLAGKMTPIQANQFLFCSNTDPYLGLFKNTDIVTEGIYFNNEDLPDFLVNGEFSSAPLTTAQMKQQKSFPTFDFVKNWVISEGVDYPNLKWTTLKPKNIDLVITDFFGGTQEVDVVESRAAEGEKVFLTATVENVGEDPAPAHKIAFFVGNQNGDFEISRDAIGADMLPAGGMQTFVSTKPWTASTAGIFNIKAVLDPDNEVDELDKTNNTAQKILNVVKAFKTLTIKGVGEGQGSVTVSYSSRTGDGDKKEDCPNASKGCSFALPSEYVLALSATPNKGSLFKGWQSDGTCVGMSNPCIFDFIKDVVINSLFDKIDPTPPPAPTNITVQPVANTRVDLHWTPSTSKNGIGGYRVYRSDNNDNYTMIIDTQNPDAYATDSSVADGTVTPGMTYRFYLVAVDVAGLVSAPSAIVTIKIPWRINVVLSGGSGRIVSTPAGIDCVRSQDAQGAFVYSGTCSAGFENPAITLAFQVIDPKYVFNGWAGQTSACGLVKTPCSFTIANSNSSAGVKLIVDAQAPAAPTNLTASLDKKGKVSLAWKAPVGVSVSGYRVFRNGVLFNSLGAITSYADSTRDVETCKAPFTYFVQGIIDLRAGKFTSVSNTAQVACQP